MGLLEMLLYLRAVSIWLNPSMTGNISKHWAVNVCASKQNFNLAWIHHFPNNAVPQQFLGTFWCFGSLTVMVALPCEQTSWNLSFWGLKAIV